MALFDKLKGKVNQIVDIDKLSEKVNKATGSIKQEIAKAVDPSDREQERLEKERLEQEQIRKAQQAQEEKQRKMILFGGIILAGCIVTILISTTIIKYKIRNKGE